MKMRKLLGWLFVASFAIVSRGATNITADVTLDAEADWRAAGKVTIAAGVTVDLNGHNLKIAGLAGEGCFTTTAVSVPVPGIIASQAMFWLDAADTSTLTINSDGQVSAWRSKVGTRVATLQSPDVAPTYSATVFALPCVDFGTCGTLPLAKEWRWFLTLRKWGRLATCADWVRCGWTESWT